MGCIMKIIVGLGNPGRRYRATPHNLGFDVADLLSKRWHAAFTPSTRERADVLEIRVGAEKVIVAKPGTFMNLSGGAVIELLRNRPVEASDLLVVSDDVNLDIGRVRIRRRGSHGGHNGLRSIIESLGSEEFARLRIGVGPEEPVIDLTRYVLSRPRATERIRLEAMTEIAADAVQCWLRDGTAAAESQFNGYREPDTN